MAKIKIAGKKKAEPAGPKAPGAIGCLLLIGMILLILGVVMYLSIAKA
jgi:hypothetical protein